jgi:peptidoglycan/LPS O-acetylase OafA/YrhL
VAQACDDAGRCLLFDLPDSPNGIFTASSLVSKFPNAPLWVQEPIRFVCIGTAITLSLLSWRYFEAPMIRFGNRVASLRLGSPVGELAVDIKKPT